jgi:hypothetical protein
MNTIGWATERELEFDLYGKTIILAPDETEQLLEELRRQESESARDLVARLAELRPTS